jgi:hypothetical protein
MCHWLFAVTGQCGLSTMGHRPNRISSLVDGLDMAALVSWPSRSPDLNPLEFIVPGQLKELAYKDRLSNIEDLVGCCYGDHWCWHFTTGTSQHCTILGHMSTNSGYILWTSDVITTLNLRIVLWQSLSECDMHYMSVLCWTMCSVRWTVCIPVQCYCFRIKYTC